MGQGVLIDDLRKDLSADRVLIVVGSGASIQATGDFCASWDGLIRAGISHCAGTSRLTDAEGERLLGQLDENDPARRIEVAERLTEALGGSGGGEFRVWLNRSLGKLELRDRTLIDAIHDLGARIATTNYDDLLSRGRDGLQDIDWTDVAAVSEFVHGDRKGVLHLHGYFDRPESVILGIRSYEALQHSEHAQAIQKAISIHDTLLFIGCGDGLSDPNLGPLIEWIDRLFRRSGYRHYCLCRTSEKEPLRQRYPGSCLAFISYGDGYHDLTPFLRKTFADRRIPAEALPPVGYCFGRSREVSRVVRGLSKNCPQTMLIQGAPGIGKTPIAKKAIKNKAVARPFRGRRWFVRCHGAKSRAEVVAAIAQAAGVAVTGETERDVLALMKKGPAALVLDNAETPLDWDRDNVEQLLVDLANIESLALVVTLRGSQRPRKVAWGGRIEPKRLSDTAARYAFLAGSKKEFAKDPYLPRILGLLDGIPLEITLMAPFAERYSSLETVWNRWKVMRSTTIDDRAAFYELSIGALTIDARRLLSVLALFPEGVAHRDLPSVFLKPDDAADELRGRSLVMDEGRRVRMVVPLREYVSQQHAPATEDKLRADAHYMELLNKSAGTGAEAIERLAPEVANIEATFVRSSGIRRRPRKEAIQSWIELMDTSGLGSTSLLREILEQALEHGITEDIARAMIRLAEIALKRSTPDAKSLYDRVLELFPVVGSND